MSSYLNKRSSPFRPTGPKRITTPASDRLSNLLHRDNTTTTSPSPTSSDVPPPIPPQSPLRAQIPPKTPPRSSSTRSAQRSRTGSNRARLGFSPGTLGEPPREEDEKPPPYSPGDAPPSVSPSNNSSTNNNNGATNNSPRGNAWSESGLMIAPKPTLKAHPAHRQSSPLLTKSGGFFTRRGGWGRILLILLILFLILGLALGLGLGLSLKKRKHSTSSNPSNTTATGFPLGTWSLPVVLQAVATACTSNPDTFTCFPYTTFSQSPSGSAYTFNWVIRTTATDPAQANTSLTIASDANTFALSFGPTPLELVSSRAKNERYTFSLPLPKEVRPSVSLSQDDARASCFFNQTVLSGVLYTRASGTGEAGAGVWPGSVWISQASPGGNETPDCLRVSDGTQIPVAGGGGSCACDWVTGNVTAGG